MPRKKETDAISLPAPRTSARVPVPSRKYQDSFLTPSKKMKVEKCDDFERTDDAITVSGTVKSVEDTLLETVRTENYGLGVTGNMSYAPDGRLATYGDVTYVTGGEEGNMRDVIYVTTDVSGNVVHVTGDGMVQPVTLSRDVTPVTDDVTALSDGGLPAPVEIIDEVPKTQKKKKPASVSQKRRINDAWTKRLSKTFSCIVCRKILDTHKSIAEHCESLCAPADNDDLCGEKTPKNELDASSQVAVDMVHSDDDGMDDIAETEAAEDAEMPENEDDGDLLDNENDADEADIEGADPGDESEYQCGECLVNFFSFKDFEEHLSGDCNNGMRICDCGKAYKTEDQLEKHRQDSCPLSTRHKCQCGKAFTQAKYLVKHQKKCNHSESKKKSFFCPVCDARFSHLSNLSRHCKQLGHTNKGTRESIVECRFCGRYSMNETLLKRHQKYMCRFLVTCPYCRTIKNDIAGPFLNHVAQHVIQYFKGETFENSLTAIRIKDENGKNLNETRDVDSMPMDVIKFIAREVVNCRDEMVDNTCVVDMSRVPDQLDEPDIEPKSFECHACGGRFQHETNVIEHQLFTCRGLSERTCPVCKEKGEMNAEEMYKHMIVHITSSYGVTTNHSQQPDMQLATYQGEPLADKIAYISLTQNKLKMIFRQIMQGEPQPDSNPPLFYIDLSRDVQPKFRRRETATTNNPIKRRSTYKKVEWKQQMIRMDDGRIQCSTCSEVFENITTYKSHYLLQHEENFVMCEICAKPFPNEHVLNSHMSVHSTERPYQCDICNKNFKHRYTLNQHLREHYGKTDCVCDICGAQFKRPYNLRMHREGAHLDVKQFQCKYCPSKFGKKSHWTKHMRIHESGREIRRRSKGSADILYPCDYCPKVFLTPAGTKAHMTTHTGEGYQCTMCDMKFTTTSALYRHEETQHDVRRAKRPYKKKAGSLSGGRKSEDVEVEFEEVEIDEAMIVEQDILQAEVQ